MSLEGGSLGFHGALLGAPGALVLFQLLVEARDFLVQSRYRVLVLLAAVLQRKSIGPRVEQLWNGNVPDSCKLFRKCFLFGNQLKLSSYTKCKFVMS